MHGADIDTGLALAVEIIAVMRDQREGLDVAPDAVGCIAVEQWRIGTRDAVDQQAIGREPVACNNQRNTGERNRSRHDQRICLQRGAARPSPQRMRRPRRLGRMLGLQARLGRKSFMASFITSFMASFIAGFFAPGFRLQARLLLGKQRQQFDRIERRWRRRERRRAENAQQLRDSTESRMHQHMQRHEDRESPSCVPMHHRDAIAGEQAEIEQPAAHQQRRDRGKERPGEHGIQRAQPYLTVAEQPAQANLIEPHARGETGANQIDRVSERQRDQQQRRLHVRHPDIFPRQDGVEEIQPLPPGRFGRDSQAGDEGDADGGRKQPVQDDRSIVRLAILHGRTPRSGRVMLRHKPRLSHCKTLTPIPGHVSPDAAM